MFPISAADFPREPAERRNGAWRGQGAGFVLSRGPIGSGVQSKNKPLRFNNTENDRVA